jgi:hypothetical protein
MDIAGRYPVLLDNGAPPAADHQTSPTLSHSDLRLPAPSKCSRQRGPARPASAYDKINISSSSSTDCPYGSQRDPLNRRAPVKEVGCEDVAARDRGVSEIQTRSRNPLDLAVYLRGGQFTGESV